MKTLILLSIVWLAACAPKNQSSSTAANDAKPVQTFVGQQQAPFNDEIQIGKNISSILQDKNGAYWFATDGKGVCRYDGKVFKYFTKTDGLPCDYVWTITQDKSGTLWFKTRDGICRYDGQKFSNDLPKNIPANPIKTAKLTTNPKNNWVNSPEGIFLTDGTTFQNFYIHPEDYKPDPANFNRPYSIYCSLVDKKGALWLGTEQKGVTRYDGKAQTWFTEKGADMAAIRCILEDRNGNIWFGNNGAGLFHYDGKTLTNFTEEKGLTNSDFLEMNQVVNKPGTLARVFSLAEDQNGNLWIGTVDSGVYKYDGKNLTNYTTKDGLTSNAILSICCDQNGKLWFGTDNGGVCKYDGKTFMNFTKTEVK